MPVSAIDVALVEGDGATVLISVRTTAGTVEIMAECDPFDRDLVLERAHIQGLHPGALGRWGLNEIAQKIVVFTRFKRDECRNCLAAAAYVVYDSA